MKAIDHKLLRDLAHMRAQVFAIILVVACGVASFVALRNIYKSLPLTQQVYYRDYRFADVFVQVKRAPEWLAERIRLIPGVGAVQTRVVAAVTLDLPGLEEPASGQLISIPENRAQMLNDLYLRRGRYIEPERRDEVIISQAFAEANHLNPGDTLSAVINGRWTPLRIVGVAMSPEFVYEIRPGDLFPDSRHFGVIWMGRKALGTAFNMEGAFNNISLQLSPDGNEREVISRLDALLEAWGCLGAYGRTDQASNHFVTNEIAELKVTSTVIPAIFLGVTAFLIHLVLSRLISTQREQLAMLKAFGYGNLVIGAHYLKLALIAVSGGILMGILVGWGFGYYMTSVYAEFFRFPVLRYEADPAVMGAAVLITLMAAAVGAIRAVRKAVALPPAEAMRPEAPARFRRGLIERLRLQRLLPPQARIIVRNIERNSWKAFLMTSAISVSVSLVVVGFYFYDAVDQILDLQFNNVMREDANVVFNEPRPASTRFELRSLPGVLYVEPYRTVPVRLRFEHHVRRLALLGVEDNTNLFRIVDRNYNVIHLPPDGLVLTTTLAERLGVKPGDVITVEVLEGARLTRQVRVAGFVDEVMGLSAYMDLRSLNRLMREGQTISGVRLAVDANELPALYSELKRTPAVSGVMIPSTALANFNETLARTMWMTTGIIVLFASVIALGVVYNGARIALSERGRELASLRVLGFTKGEIAAMLLGEQAILMLVAIPAGCVIGYLLCFVITKAVDNEMMRLPLLITGRTPALAFLVTAGASLLSGLLVQWRLRRLNLVEVLKTRE
jgi:putative ABC transport system permease protein